MFYDFTDELVEGGKEVLDPDIVQPERRIIALHWISRWVDNIWVFWRQNETEAAACTHFIYRRLMEQIG